MTLEELLAAQDQDTRQLLELAYLEATKPATYMHMGIADYGPRPSPPVQRATCSWCDGFGKARAVNGLKGIEGEILTCPYCYGAKYWYYCGNSWGVVEAGKLPRWHNGPYGEWPYWPLVRPLTASERQGRQDSDSGCRAI